MADTPTSITPVKPTDSIPPKKPQNNVALITRTCLDALVGLLIYLAADHHIISGEIFTVMISALFGIRLSDIATIRKSRPNNNDSEPPIAGGMIGALMGAGGSIIDLFRNGIHNG